ncbi:MAG: hypothetical protein MRY49_01180 [Candidatus Pacebacteria bacterium]|nr:hypothetical protein [Candidatus Paceibacterota bacterium]
MKRKIMTQVATVCGPVVWAECEEVSERFGLSLVDISNAFKVDPPGTREILKSVKNMEVFTELRQVFESAYPGSTCQAQVLAKMIDVSMDFSEAEECLVLSGRFSGNIIFYLALNKCITFAQGAQWRELLSKTLIRNAKPTEHLVRQVIKEMVSNEKWKIFHSVKRYSNLAKIVLCDILANANSQADRKRVVGSAKGICTAIHYEAIRAIVRNS